MHQIASASGKGLKNKVENIVAKGEISQFSFCHNVSKSRFAAEVPESVCMWERVKTSNC